MKKIPISINESEEKAVIELSELLGMGIHVYGWFPRTIKGSIALTLMFIKKTVKDIPDMEESELDLFLSTVRRAKIRDMLHRKALELEKQATKV